MDICFYHKKDLDGHCSGALVKAECPDCQMVGIDYGDQFFWDLIQEKHVIMCDISLDPEDMLRLRQESALFVWVDHHRTSIDKMAKANLQFAGIQREGLGACALVWEYCHLDEPMPTPVRLLAAYDVWDHSDPLTLPLQAAVNSYYTDPADWETCKELWLDLFFAGEDQVMLDSFEHEGNTLLRNKEKWGNLFGRQKTFLLHWDGLIWLAANGSGGSRFFDSVTSDPQCPYYDGMMTFEWAKGRWKIGMYADQKKPYPLNVGKVALRHGGGGHPGAAGFEASVLPFALSMGAKQAVEGWKVPRRGGRY